MWCSPRWGASSLLVLGVSGYSLAPLRCCCSLCNTVVTLFLSSVHILLCSWNRSMLMSFTSTDSISSLKGLCRLHYRRHWGRIFSVSCIPNRRPRWLFKLILHLMMSKLLSLIWHFYLSHGISGTGRCLMAFSGSLWSVPLIRHRSSSWLSFCPSALFLFFSHWSHPHELVEAIQKCQPRHHLSLQVGICRAEHQALISS